MPPEPTASIAIATSAGFAAIFMSAIGIEPQPVFWGLIGATLGLSLATQVGRWRAVAVFVCVVLTSALVGTLIATGYFQGSTGWRNVTSLIVAVFFHPIFSALVAAVPGIVQAGLRRLGLGGQP